MRVFQAQDTWLAPTANSLIIHATVLLAVIAFDLILHIATSLIVTFRAGFVNFIIDGYDFIRQDLRQITLSIIGAFCRDPFRRLTIS